MFRQSRYLKLKRWWMDYPWVGVLCVVAIAGAAYTFWTAAPTFSDPDAFYHLKITELIIHRRAAVTDFPWLEYTILKNSYVDHHLLYHIFLIPFVLFFGSAVGMKVGTVILATSTITLFYFMLRRVRVPAAFGFAMLLLFTESFSFRMGLAKAPSVGFLFLMAGFLLMTQRRLRLLALLGFFYVWAYGGFVLLLVLAVIMGCADIIVTLLRGRRATRALWWRAASPCIVVAFALAAGLLIHPSFPQHLQFYWQQIVDIGLVNYQDVIGVGGEWYPMKFSNLFGGPILLSIMLIAALAATVAAGRRQHPHVLAALMMSAIFFAFTLKSQRYIEYYVPWGYLFVVLSLSEYGWLRAAPRYVQHHLRRLHSWPETALAVLVTLTFVVLVPAVMITDARRLTSSLRTGIPVTQFAGIGTWLRQHANPGDIVFQDDWDNFPVLFHNAAKVRYIVGLDPTFMYNFHRDLYWKWANITTGKQTDHILETIAFDFHARFVVVDREHPEFQDILERDGRFLRVYEDEDGTIYRVPRQRAEVSASPTSVGPE